MLTIGLSVLGSIKLLERNLAVRMRIINRMVQESVYSLTSAAAVTEVADVATEMPKTLRIARTTMPDRRLEFGQTFEYIRYELEAHYKSQNPAFTNTAVPHLWEARSGAEAQSATAPMKKKASKWEATTPALNIAKTTLPDERLDFNQTFERVRQELVTLYREQNALS